MSQLIPESPQSFNYTQLTDQQFAEGSVLSMNQKLVLQNQRAAIAEQLLGLEFDTDNHLKFVQNQAFLQGQLAMLKWLLDASFAAESALVDLAKMQEQMQNPDQQPSVY
jgi:hypothetical protein